MVIENCSACEKELSNNKHIVKDYLLCDHCYCEFQSTGYRKMNEEPIIQFKGGNGKLELYENFVRINSGTFLGFVFKGLKGQKDIYFSKVGSIQIKKPGFTRGYIQFSILGGNESTGGVVSAISDENTIIFGTLGGSTKQYELALKVKEYIEKRIEPNNSNYSSSDEIEKLHSLMKKGILTREEFEDKKAKLLD